MKILLIVNESAFNAKDDVIAVLSPFQLIAEVNEL